MAGSFKIRKAKDGQFFFNLHAENGEKVLTSEMYKAKQSALNGIESVKKNSQVDANYQAKMSKRNLHYFVLVAANKEIIGNGEEYSSESAMKEGMASVKRLAAGAKIEDLTTM